MRRRRHRRRARWLHLRVIHGARGPPHRHPRQEPERRRFSHHEPHRQLPGRRQVDGRRGAAGQDARAGRVVRHGLPSGAGVHGRHRGRPQGRLHARRHRQGARARPRDGRHGPDAVVRGRGRVPRTGRELLRDVRRRLLPGRRGLRRRRRPGGRRGGRVPDEVRVDGALGDAVRPQVGRDAARARARARPSGGASEDGSRRRRGRDVDIPRGFSMAVARTEGARYSEGLSLGSRCPLEAAAETGQKKRRARRPSTRTSSTGRRRDSCPSTATTRA
mmetsp:Transcript_18054/g.55538  ORF Transcript_18054/g.55538 Transcript_18054/m.55538 type:complete len:275 (-) Transcript_18054:360-1184(-)